MEKEKLVEEGSDWREAWHPKRVQVFGRISDWKSRTSEFQQFEGPTNGHDFRLNIHFRVKNLNYLLSPWASWRLLHFFLEHLLLSIRQCSNFINNLLGWLFSKCSCTSCIIQNNSQNPRRAKRHIHSDERMVKGCYFRKRKKSRTILGF